MLTPLLLALVLLPDVVMPRPTELSNLAGDSVELERQAHRLGPARLLRLLQRPQSDKGRLAFLALRGLSLVATQHPEVAGQAALPLLDLLEQAGDDKLRQALSDTLLRVCQVLGRSLPCDEPDDLGCGGDLASLPLRLVQLAEKPSQPVLSRSVALSALQALPFQVWQTSSPRLFALAQRESGPVRTTVLAALSVLHQQAGKPELLALATLPDDSLAAAASQELCWPLLAHKPNAKPSAAPAASVVPDAVLRRAREIAAGTQPLAVRLQTIECLRATGLAQDKALLLQLATAAKAAKNRK